MSGANYQRNYSGKIGDKLNVEFHIENLNGSISGFYYYEKIGIDIKIIGRQHEQTLNLYELDFKNDTIAFLNGTITDSIISGVWINAMSKKSYPLLLNETRNKLKPLPPDIAGKYIDSNCNLILKISKVKGEYYYIYTSTQRTLKGKVTFSRGSENYLILQGIEYSEDYFDVALPEENELSRQYEELRKRGERNVGIDCYLDSDELIIQNYGNAMAYYVKLGECDEKYIHLIKQ